VPDDCLFCRIVRKEIPATIVAEDEHCIAFRDIAPKAPVHILVIPREHVASLDEATDPTMVGRMALFAAEVARKEGIAKAGYRTIFNTNAGAGQTVFHLHLHLLGGRDMKWPPG
jgi:histidine triad (HIT) family protein